MQPEVEQLVRELSSLQARRGLQEAYRGDAAGVLITKALSLDQHPAGEQRRKALVAGLLSHAENLPPDLRLFFINACAIRSEHRPTLSQRLEHSSAVLKLNVRTGWRRLSDANELVAASLAAVLDLPETVPPREWVLTSLHSVTDLTVSRPVFRSTHTLRVVSPYLTRITERISFPGAEVDADPEFKVSGDCVLARVERPFQVSWSIDMSLLRTFRCGESITYSLSVRAPSRRLVHPMSVILPERECRSFSTQVNFGQPSVAARVWRFDGVPAPAAELEEPSGELLDPHREPVLTAAYENMVRGRVYGLRWEWAEGIEGG